MADGNLWSRSALAWLHPRSGAAWDAGPARLPRHTGVRGEKVIGSVEVTQPLYFCFRKQPNTLPVLCVSYVLT